jgi:hypothetical protein
MYHLPSPLTRRGGDDAISIVLAPRGERGELVGPPAAEGSNVPTLCRGSGVQL